MYSGLRKLLAHHTLHGLRDDHLRHYPQLAVFAFDHISHKINLSGRYERDELECLGADVFPHIGRGLCLDIGANIGNHSLFFAEHFERVLAFEPNPRVFRLLQLNAELADNVSCFDFGASSHDAQVLAHQDGANLGATRIVESAVESSGEIRVPVRALDGFLEQESASEVDFIKIDVEGHELAALEGLAGTLRASAPVVAFESRAEDIVDGRSPVVDFLAEAGYEYFYEVRSHPWLDALPGPIRKGLKLAILLAGGDLERTATLRAMSYPERKYYAMIVALKDGLGRA